MFDPQKFVDFADGIYVNPKIQTDASIRTAISRAYIAVLSQSKQKLEERNIILQDEQLHQSVLKELKKYDSKLADKLDELNDYCINADFNLDIQPDKDTIPFVTAIAKSFHTIRKQKLP
ncbi:hypothetical protein [Candidatus Nitrosopumilus sediminis]|uniref:Uncharacterized protein n=1 Tax=Candidatus Nitrosopumilus sediminis TaxID=1229909 RepID=K0BDL2_9ARCH|nr:hypothetical protein [Candidatus Nitrosopumilus sediminis]AFS83145.1 hypothetical protein NSED_06735 [Candidatus Nitrosopumilus sediminis]